MAYDIGPKIGIEGEKEFREAIRQINTNMRTLGTEMQAVSSQFDKGDKSQEAYTAKNEVLNKQIEEQKKKLEQLVKGLDASSEKYGENDKTTQGWRQAVNKATADLNNMERELGSNIKAMDEFGDEIAEANDRSGKFSKTLGTMKEGLKGIGKGVGKAAILGIKGVATAAVAAGTGLIAMTESTKEYRKELSILEQNAKDSGNSFKIIKEELSGMTALTGDSGAAVEGLSNLMATGFEDEQITSAVDALAGAVIKFPDTLKFESLSDGLQETLATGKAIGPFSELIERMGGDLDEFNAALAGATTEAERQQVALDWLANSGLSQVSEEYRKANEATLKAAEAQFKMEDAMASLSTTVEPAIATLKSGVADMVTSLVGIVTGTEGATEDFKGSISTFTNNVVGMVESLIPTVSTAMQALIPALIEGITTALPLLGEAATSIIILLITELLGAVPELVPVALEIINTIVNSIIELLPELVPVAVDIILGLAETLVNNLDMLVNAGIGLIMALVDGLINALPMLIEKAPQIINSFWEAFDRNLFVILAAGVALIIKLGQGIIESIPLIIANAGEIVSAIFNTISHLNLLSVGKNIIMTLGKGLSGMTGSIFTIIKDLIAQIINNFKSINWADVGKNIISGIAKGVAGKAKDLAEGVKDAAKGALDGAKRFLGIKSPSTVMRDQVGKMIGAGMAEGISDSARQVDKAMNGLNGKLTADGAVNLNTNAKGIANNGSSVEHRHSGTITVKGVNDSNEFVGVVDMVLDQLRREVRTQ